MNGSSGQVMRETVVSVPGKIILCGEHAVVYGKEAVAFALNLRTTCALSDCNSTGELKIEVPGLSISETYNTADIHQLYEKVSSVCLAKEGISGEHRDRVFHKIEDKFLQFIEESNQKVVLKIVIYLYHIVVSASDGSGLVVSVSTTLPIGGGLGSSASFCVALVTAFFSRYGVISCNGKLSSKDYELINTHAYQMECLVHGKPSGIDNSISTYGGALSFKAGKIEQLHQLNKFEMKVLVIDTKQQRRTKQLVASVLTRKNKFPELFDSIFASIERVTQAMKENLIQLAQGEGDVMEKYSSLQELVDVNQCLLESIGVGHPIISSIVAMCHKYGFHAKLTGAGGGGCVFAIIPPEHSVDQLEGLMEELEQNSFKVWATVLGAKGVEIH